MKFILFFAVHTLPNLTVLSLSGCSKITDDGIELIAENLRKLRSLDISWCPRVTDAALEYIACDLNNLEELTLDRLVGCKLLDVLNCAQHDSKTLKAHLTGHRAIIITQREHFLFLLESTCSQCNLAKINCLSSQIYGNCNFKIIVTYLNKTCHINLEFPLLPLPRGWL